MNTQCEICRTARATMLLYAKNPGTPIADPKRNDNPFYPHQEANIAINCCTDCFHDMAASMREEQYVQIRATGVVPNKVPYDR